MKKIYLHGLGQTAESWNKVVEIVRPTNSNMCLDLTKLVKDKKTSYSNLYSAFSEMCNTENGQIILCGLSVGGVLALNYAIDHPDKVKALVLIAAQYKMPKKALKLQNVLFRFMPKSAFQQTGFSKLDFINLCTSMADLDFSASIKRISCPTLIIYGEKDRANKEASLRLADALSNSQLQIIQGAGHEVNIDAPEILASTIQKFFVNI